MDEYEVKQEMRTIERWLSFMLGNIRIAQENINNKEYPDALLNVVSIYHGACRVAKLSRELREEIFPMLGASKA